jgi:radical SAM protein (TIGR01212 family)
MAFYYNSFNQYMIKRFGCTVYKVTIDAGFTCPNRDGSKGTGGCIFCPSSGASSLVHKNASIKEQIEENCKVRRTRYHADKFIAYFQSFTNTYADHSHLKTIYDQVLGYKDIVGLSIATRSDCVDEEKIRLIASYKDYFPYVNVEYGMQSMHNKTLKKINQCSSLEDLEKALDLTKKYNLEYSLHVILNLPGETKEEQLETANYLAEIRAPHVKIHLLCAMKNTPFAQVHKQGLWKSLTFEEYISLICDFLERLPPQTIIDRLGGGGHPKEVIEPTWLYDQKDSIVTKVLEEFQKRNTHQGFLVKSSFSDLP